MIIPEKLKLNKFRLVLMPRNRDYFARYNNSSEIPDSAYGGDENPSIQRSKLDQLNAMRQDFDNFRKEVESV